MTADSAVLDEGDVDIDSGDASSSDVDTEDFPSEYTSASGGTPASDRTLVVGSSAATGRRKEAVARVRLAPGTGQWSINGRSLEDYFPNKVHQQIVAEPLRLLGGEERFDVVARLHGGGVTGQAGALRLGIARALNAIDVENHRPELKKAGLLTRDARVKERKHYGLKKARKAPQYSKR